MYAKKQEIEKLRYLSKDKCTTKKKIWFHSSVYRKLYRKESSEILHISLRTVNANVTLYKKRYKCVVNKKLTNMQKTNSETGKELYNILATKTPKEAGIAIFANLTTPLACFLVKSLDIVRYACVFWYALSEQYSA